MIGSFEGTYASSDNAVAYVNENGLITAAGAGKAIITCTASDGSKESVTINVLQPQLIAVAAGINPTFYDAGSVSSFNRSTIMVKAIYSDGSAVQLSDGYSVGELSDSGNGAYDVPLSYQGFSSNLSLFIALSRLL